MREAWIICDRCGKREPGPGEGAWSRFILIDGAQAGELCPVCTTYVMRHELREPVDA